MLLSILVVSSLLNAPVGSITIHTDRALHALSPTFYGLMTEEINHSYDGGLYGELLRNRSFRDRATTPAGWDAVGGATLTLDHEALMSGQDGPVLRVQFAGIGESGVANAGYWGVPIWPHTAYRFSLDAKADGGTTLPVTVLLEHADATVAAEASVQVGGSGWHTYGATLRTGGGGPENGRFVILSKGSGQITLGYASLFPPTFHNRANGNRRDLMEMLGAMHPAFLRLPGGNYLEGDTIPTRFDWKTTLGPPDRRTGHQGPWGYRSSDGLGLLEYLEWCEDLKMSPLLAVYAGYSLRQQHVNAGPDLLPYVLDALDEIEFVTGGPNTKWGARRAQLGHPKPFPLTYVEVGNEDNFDRRGYEARFAQFFDAIRAKYPKLQIIATAHVESRRPDMVDDHYYRSAVGNARDWGHYDDYDRHGPAIFVGEWASMEGNPTPNWHGALGDAVWLMGLERNSDIVKMESYAPLMVNVNPGARQWGTNLIGYDALHSFGSPSYYVQALYGSNAGTELLACDLDDKLPPPTTKGYSGKFGFGTYNTHAEYKDVEVTSGERTLFASTQVDSWTPSDDWTVSSGTIATTGNVVARTTAGDTAWTNYRIQCKARKVSGREGFAIVFHYRDDDHTWQWNIGGWNNTATRFERFGEGWEDVDRGSSFKVETGRWYDLDLRIQDGHLRGYIDGRLVSEADEQARITPIYTDAVRTASGDVVLKVVNLGAEPGPMSVILDGQNAASGRADIWTIQGQPDDVNTVADPKKVAPRRSAASVSNGRFAHTFPPYSVTLIRFKH